MRRLLHLKNHPFIVPIVTLFGLVFLSLVLVVATGGETVAPADTRIVQLYIDGKAQTVPTRAVNVKEMLEHSGVNIGKYDRIEPSATSEITDDNFVVNVYRARPVMVVDNGKKVVTYSSQPNPEAVAKDAGVKLYPEDIVEARPADVTTEEVLKDGLVAEKVVIDRATPVTINLYGTPVNVRTHVQTVGELLKEKNVVVAKSDTLQPSADTPITDKTQIFVTRFGTKVVTVEEVIAAPVETRDDPGMPSGSSTVLEAGSNGRKVVTYEVQLKNNKEVGRKVIQQVIATPAKARIVVRGTRVVISDPSGNAALGQQIANEMGYGSQFYCIDAIFSRESGWNHLAYNRNSGAYGIPQALPGSKMGPGWESDPAVQIRWGIGYMVNRYGSPCAAEDFWNLNHWY